jgi:endonuclease/exonuclease/phosphatase family metal-dependent hydrolase
MLARKLFLLVLLPAVLFSQSCGPEDVVNPVTPPNSQEGGGEGETPPPTPSGNADPMVICTFNIRYANTSDTYPDGSSAAWKDRSASVKKFFDTVKPDLVGLQEIRKEQAQWFASELSSDYGYYDVGRDSNSGSSVSSAGGEGVGVLYRKDRFELVSKDFFWLDQSTRTLPEKNADGTYGAWNSACRRITLSVVLKDKKHGNALIYFFPTHYDHKSTEARKNSADLMVTQMKNVTKATDLKQAGVIVFHVGDLNTTHDSAQLKSLNDNLYYARLTAGGTDKDTGTYNGFGDKNSIIDHVYYGGKAVKPVKYWVDRTNYGVPFLSDHYPVLFQWEYQ